MRYDKAPHYRDRKVDCNQFERIITRKMGKSFAICIGINNYDNLKPLSYAKQDAGAMRDYFLKEAGFEKVYYFADDAPDIEQDYGSPFKPLPTFAKLDRFLDIRFEQGFLGAGDNFWFFFAGHGKRHRDRDYLLPSDVNPRNIERTAISINYVTERLRRCGADNVILLLDACRNEGDRDGEGIGIEKQKGIVTLFACSPSERSYEIDELQHGAFTYTLLQGLRIQGQENCATVERLYQYLRCQVPALNSHYQRPRQTPYSIVEPSTKSHLILLPEQATSVDVQCLKTDALEAEAEQDWELAEQLWRRVLSVCPSDPSAFKGLKRIWSKSGSIETQVETNYFDDVENGTENVLPVDVVDEARSQCSSIKSVPRASFTFEMVKINAQGEETERRQDRVASQIEDLGSGIILELVSIPGGSLMMGSLRGEKGRTKCEGPQHEVKVQPFLIGRYPVTQDQWNVVSFLPKVNLELKASPARFKGNTHPIECISWYEAVEFRDRLSCYTGREYRLPSEAEWEYACRAGTTTPFHFGGTLRTDDANYHGEYPYVCGTKGRYRHSTTSVDEFSCANAFGLSDIHGNVFEWCQDIWHENYVEAPLDERAWMDGGDHASRVIRGGSWSSDPIVCRSAYRCQAEADSRNDGLGFRVVVSIPRDAEGQNS